jgi:hypothetical protein
MNAWGIKIDPLSLKLRGAWPSYVPKNRSTVK